MVITYEGGLKFVAEARGHRVETDQPVRAGGADAAMMPLELLSAALGTCVALYVNRFLAARSLPHESVRVEVRPVHAANPNRIARFEVNVELPEGVPAELRALIERVAASCPAHHTLAHGAEIAVALETAPAAAGGGLATALPETA